MTTAPELDPYLLPLPALDSPIVLPHLANPMHAHLTGRYGDPIWPLAPLTGNPSVSKHALHWETWPAPFRDEMRLAVWNLINGQLRPTFVQVHAAKMRARLSLQQAYSAIRQWRHLALWLEEKGESALSRTAPPVSFTTTACTCVTAAAAAGG